METSDLAFFKKWLQSNKNFTYSFNEFFVFNKLCKFHAAPFAHFFKPACYESCHSILLLPQLKLYLHQESFSIKIKTGKVY